MVESLLNVLENKSDPLNFELSETEVTSPIVYVTTGVTLNEETPKTFG